MRAWGASACMSVNMTLMRIMFISNAEVGKGDEQNGAAKCKLYVYVKNCRD